MPHRRLALACAAALAGLSLAGCGFSPLYSSAGYGRLAGLTVEAGPERFDFLVQDAIRDFTGPGSSRYVLRVSTDLGDAPVGISPSGEATRSTLTADALWELETAGGPLTGSRSVSLGFDQPRDPYALLAARGEAEERLAALLAEAVIQDIAVALRRHQDGPGS
ncbi:MAG: hypothetical protein ACFE0P_13195 [Oceanicaulis sp.]